MGAVIRGQTGLRQAAVCTQSHVLPLDAKEAVLLETPAELFEKDTDEAEDSLQLNELLLPPVVGVTPPLLPTKVSRFSVSYNMQVILGWVKQPSPCCAAASVAGAWNAIFDLRRSDPQALSHIEVLDIYVDHLITLITNKTAAFGRKLGASLAPLLAALNESLEAQGMSLGGKDGPKRDAQLQLVEGLVKDAIHSARKCSPAFTSTVSDVSLPGSVLEAAAAQPCNIGCTSENVPEECLALPVYERLWELYRSEAAEPNAEEAVVEHPHAVVEAPPACSEEEPQEAVQVCNVASLSAEEPEEERAAQVPAAENAAPPQADTPAAAPGKKGVLLEFNFDGQPTSKKKKKKAPPKAVVKRLQASNQPRRSAAPSADNADSDREVGDEDDGTGAGAAEEVQVAERLGEQAWWESSWNWREDLLDILRLEGGVAKLKHPLKPSTSAIGNWAIIAAFKKLESKLPAPLAPASLSARPIMGRGKSRGPGTKAAAERGEYAGLREGYGPSALEDAWRLLRDAFLAPGSAVIFHLKNHYALIFALREWEEEPAHSLMGCASISGPSAPPSATPAAGLEGEESQLGAESQGPPADASAAPTEAAAMPGGPTGGTGVEATACSSDRRRRVRQLLTARRGQRPTVWMDFEEAVKTMLGWEGYKMIQVLLK